VMGSRCKQMLVEATGVDVHNNIITASNYNKTECTGERGKCGCIHAEIALLDKMPNPRYVTVSLSPCLNCAKALVEAGVESVRYHTAYRLTDGIDYLKEHHVRVHHTDNDFDGSWA